MDSDVLLDCCLAVPSSHSHPGLLRWTQPLHRAGVLEHASGLGSLSCCSASSPCHSGVSGTTSLGGETSHLAPVGSLSCPGRSLCGHPRRRSTPCRLPPRAGSGALCSRPDHRVARANGGAGGGPNVLHFAGPAFYGRARIFGSRLNEERPFPVLSLRRLLPGKTIATIDGKGNLAYNGSQQKRREARTRASPKDRTDECSTCANENQGALPCTRYALVRALAPARPRCLADPGRPHLDYLLRQPAGVHRSITHCLCWVNVRLPAAYSGKGERDSITFRDTRLAGPGGNLVNR